MEIQIFSSYYLKCRCYSIGNTFLLDLTGKIIEKRIHRRLQDDDLKIILEFLKSEPQIRYLDLSYNNITSDGFSNLMKYLTRDENLIYLNLMYNDIKDIDKNIADLSILWHLKSLILSGNKFGECEGISTLIQMNESLIQLELADTDQTMKSSIDILSTFIPEYRITKNITPIKILNISRIGPLNKQMETVYMMHVMRFLEKVLTSHRFVRLTLSTNCITDSDIEILQDALSRCTELDTLDLSCNLITSHGLELLSNILPYTNIEYLNLSVNRIGDDGASALGVIWHQTKIKHLDISKNKIQDCGMINLLVGIKERSDPIEAFYIFGNPLTELTANELYIRVYLGYIPPHALDIQFDWNSDGNLLIFENCDIKKMQKLKDIIHELNIYKKFPEDLCCQNTDQGIKKRALQERHKEIQKLFLYYVKYFDLDT